MEINKQDIEKEREIIKELQQQLAEKDKEIERLKRNMEFDTAYYIKELVNIRKQVCDEIREKLGMNECNTCENTAFGVYYDKLKEILDQIEQGEQ